MELQNFSVKLTEIIREFGLEVIYEPDNMDQIEVTTSDVNRPALQLIGYFNYFDPSRLQILGETEDSYIRPFTPEKRQESFERLFEKQIPALIITKNLQIYPECLAAAKTYDIPLLRTSELTSNLTSALVASLNLSLAPRITMHGVLVEVYGEGVLILGDSGVGKSETAIELVKRGHRLIADDAVEIKKVSSKTLVGSAPEVIRHFIELRGIGVVDVRRIFGLGAVKETENIQLIIKLEPWEDGKAYDRLGMDDQYTSIMDIRVPSLVVPVKPGRNLAVIIEVAAMNNRHKKMGFNAAKDLTDRMSKAFNMPEM